MLPFQGSSESILFFGVGISLMALTFDGSGWAPCLLQTQSKNLTELLLTSHFFVQCQPMFSCNLLLSCSASSLPCIIISSVIPMTPSQRCRIWSVILWKISCAHASRNGRCTKRNLNLCVLRVVRRDDS